MTAARAFWMVVAIKNGAQTPYNFPTQSKAQQFMQSLTGIDGVQLLKMQGNPVQNHTAEPVSGPPAKGKYVQPNLLSSHLSEWNPEVLNISGLEWAGHGSRGDSHRYELIGHHDALLALACVEPHMLAVGLSRKKQGEGYKTQTLVNDRFRLELWRDFKLDEATLKPTQRNVAKAREYDAISFGLHEAAVLVAKYPKELRADLSAGLCTSAGNGWQLLQSFPWLAVRVFAFDDRSAKEARALVRQGAKTREIAEIVDVPMSFKRFIPKVSKQLLKHHEVLARHPNVVSHHCPSKPADQGSWLTNFNKALSSGSEEFAFWVAVHWNDLQERESNLQTVRSVVIDLRDWVRACIAESIGAARIESICHMINDEDVVESLQGWLESNSYLAEAGKPFNKEMALQTVLKLSDEWHERQSGIEAAGVEFPQEWYAGGTVGDFRIEPIRTSAELSKYAYHFHNCATGYAHEVAKGSCFIYVVFEGDELRAMLEITGKARTRANLSQLKGPRNIEVSEELRAAVHTWWESAKRPTTDETAEPLALAS